MKISPIPSLGATVGAISTPGSEQPQSMAQRVRAVRMNTNATPGRVDDAPLPISDTGDPAQVANEETQPLSPQFAALAKQKRALQVKEREIAAREKALSAAPTQGAGVDIARLKSDPLGVLLEAGVTYEQLTEAVLANNNGVTPEIQALKAKIKALEEGVDKKLTDRDTQQEQQALAEMRREALQLITHGDAFELVRETQSVPTVMSLIERTYRKTGEVLDVREALRLVENELLKDSLKLAQLQKVQGQLAPRPAQPQQRPMRTLTNRDTASVPMSAKARAIAAFQGTLKR